MAQGDPIWQLLLEGARRMTSAGQTPFTRAELIAEVQTVNASQLRSSIDPIIQGMTDNAKGGTTSACGLVFHRVGRGEYELLDDGSSPPGQPRARSMPPRGRGRVDVEHRVHDLIEHFDEFVAVYDRGVPFRRARQYESHRATIDRRYGLGSAAAALEDEEFLRSLHETLRRWGIGIRGSRLVAVEDFGTTLAKRRDEIIRLDGLSIEDHDLATEAVGRDVYALMQEIGVADNKARIVAGTKTLLHLLPDLVPPMDRAWTGLFFGWSTLAPQNAQERIFTAAWSHLARVAQETRPSRLVGAGWRTCTAKILDNALIGWCKQNHLAPA